MNTVILTYHTVEIKVTLYTTRLLQTVPDMYVFVCCTLSKSGIKQAVTCICSQYIIYIYLIDKRLKNLRSVTSLIY